MKTDMIVRTGIFVALTVLLSYIFAIHTTFISLLDFYQPLYLPFFMGRWQLV